MGLCIGILVAVALAVLAARYFIGSRAQPRDFKSTDEMMMWLAAEAVDMADKNFKTKLDFTTNSIEKVEEILGKLHQEYVEKKPDGGASGLAMAYGAYIGECIKKDNPGSRWERDHSVGGEKSYPLHWRGGESFPCAWCFRRITEGPEDNVWHKYLALRQR